MTQPNIMPCTEAHKVAQKKWREANKLQCRRASKAYYEKNRQKIRAQQKMAYLAKKAIFLSAEKSALKKSPP